jgi:hypothetical protein
MAFKNIRHLKISKQRAYFIIMKEAIICTGTMPIHCIKEGLQIKA